MFVFEYLTRVLPMNRSSAALPTPPGERWLAVAFITAFAVGTDLFVIAPLLPAMARHFGLEPARLSFVVSLFSLAYALASPLFGRWSRGIGLARLMRFGLLVLGAANLFTAYAPSVLVLACSRVLAGLGAASVTPTLYALTARRAAVARRGRSLAVVSAGLVLALAGGAPLGLLLGGLWNWHWVFVGLAIVLFVIAVLQGAHGETTLAPVLEADRALEPSRAAAAPQRERLRAATPLLAAMMLWAFAVYGSYTLLSTALLTALDWPLARVAAMLVCFGAGATLGSLGGGRLADRNGAARIARRHLLLAALGFVLVAIVLRWPSAWVMGALLFLLALVVYGVFPSLQSLAAQQFDALRATVFGLLSSALYGGITLGAAVAAPLYRSGGMAFVLASSAVAALAAAAIADRLVRADAAR